MSARSPHDDGRIRAWLAESRTWIERQLEASLAASQPCPARLVEALRYVLFGGGKRLRPAIVRMVCAHFGGADEAAARPAVAIECVHTYSLVHDDLPCMDDDDLRRGRPTCHKVFGEALAILAGDALLTLAFEVLSSAPHDAAVLIGILARASGPAGMVGGQVLDLERDAAALEHERDQPRLEHERERPVPEHKRPVPERERPVPERERPAPERERVAEIHRLKTAALFSAACEMGAVAAGCSAEQRRASREYGELLGLCFQAVDDVLDVTGDARTLGKTPGKDARHAKPTLVAVLGVPGARAQAQHLAESARGAARALPGGRGDLPLQLVDLLLARST